VPSQRGFFVFNTLDGFPADAAGHDRRNRGNIELYVSGFPDIQFGLPLKLLF